MPIGAQEWRVRTGLINASRTVTVYRGQPKLNTDSTCYFSSDFSPSTQKALIICPTSPLIITALLMICHIMEERNLGNCYSYSCYQCGCSLVHNAPI